MHAPSRPFPPGPENRKKSGLVPEVTLTLRVGHAGVQAECQIRVHTQMPLAHPTQLHNQSHLVVTSSTFGSANNNVETPRGEPILEVCTAHDDTGKDITEGQCNRFQCASMTRHMHPARVQIA